ncbi:MAG: hypothetical protein WC370_00195 [Dehalococcoidales bacterium]
MKLKKDISEEMGIIAKAIPTIAYAPSIPVGSFRYKNWRVILNKKEINIKDIEKEADAIEVMNYLKELVSNQTKNNSVF